MYYPTTLGTTLRQVTLTVRKISKVINYIFSSAVIMHWWLLLGWQNE